MARKKSRQARPASGRETAVVPQHAVTGVTAAPPGKGLATPAVKMDRLKHDRFWLEPLFVGASKALGSLQVAVIGLSLFAFVLAVGTVVESWYSGRVAQELVYRTWWFTGLLGVLWVNIFFAAAKKARLRRDPGLEANAPPRTFLATVQYWWPWMLVGCIFVMLFAEGLPWWVIFGAVAVCALALSIGFWGLEQHWPAERWWPWQRHQTGFVITHVGLLTMVFGGIVNSLAGVDALLPLVDSSHRAMQREGGAPQVSRTAIDQDASLIRVTRLPEGKDKEEVQAFRFEPGALPWHVAEKSRGRLDWLPVVLNGIAHPLSRSWWQDLGNGATLEVLDYQPHTRRETFRPAEPGDTPFPAVKYRLSSSLVPMGKMLPTRWVAGDLRNSVSSLATAGTVEMLGRCPSAMLDDFLKPPAMADLGKKGQVVLRLGGEKYRFSVDDCLGRDAQPIGKTGWKVKFTDYIADFLNHKSEGEPAFPLVMFELIAPDGNVARYRLAGRFAPATPVRLKEEGKRLAAAELDDLQAWYHAPDPRYGDVNVRGVLQFVSVDDSRLAYRSFHSAGLGGFRFEGAGEAKPGDEDIKVWQGMDWRLEVVDFLPGATEKVQYVPEVHRPGLERQDLTAAVRCKLTADHHGHKESKEFWLGKSEDGEVVSVAGQQFKVSFNVLTRELPFEIKLLRAESLQEKGTQMAATYTSYVQLYDKEHGIDGDDHVITMNEPLEYAGYKLYQSGYKLLPFPDENFRPVSQSTFTVGRDPGLPLKYAGSIMLALGIACMFYMKAYFFKPRGKQAPAAAAATGEA
jgi:hypothetical protein